MLLAKVATADSACEHQHFSISTDAEDDQGGDGGQFQVVTRRGRGAQKTQGAQATGKGATWTASVQGRWCKHKGAADAAEPSCMDAAADGAREGKGGARDASSSARTNNNDQAANPTIPATGGPAENRGKRGAREGDDESQPPCGKSHRGDDDVQMVSVEGGGDDAARAAKLRQEQEAAIEAARQAGATFGDEASAHIAGQLYAHKVQLVVERAKAAGVEPTSEGKSLIELAPHEFNAWVQHTLAPADRAAAENKEL